MTQLSEEVAAKRIGDGQLTCLREMVRDQIYREGDGSSFSMRSGLLLSMIDELASYRFKPSLHTNID